MRVLLTFLLCSILVACSEDAAPENNPLPPVVAKTSIPDVAFEQALIDENFDDILDGEVATASIEFIANLNLDNLGIQDLSGIGDFEALENLSVRNNALSSIDVSSNPNLLFLWAEDNVLTDLNLGINPGIEKIGLSGNQLTALQVTDYTQLQLITVDGNLLSSLDVSTCASLNTLDVSGNPLTCVLVSPEQLNSIPSGWVKDPEDSFSLDCE